MDRRIAHVIERMQQDLQRKTPIPDLAAEVGLSVSRFGQLFRRATGTSPGAYLHALRMQRARTLVETTALSIHDVMVQVGLTDPSHFARDFRNAHGLSPRAYRLQVRLAGPPARYVAVRRRSAATVDAQPDPPSGVNGAAASARRHACCVNTQEGHSQCKR